jgi:hypothetical protein
MADQSANTCPTCHRPLDAPGDAHLLVPAADVPALLKALRRGVAEEQTEISRKNIRLIAGYGDAGTRATMSHDADDAAARQRVMRNAIVGLERR